MIRNPINVFPYNNIVDANQPSNFRFTFSGDKLRTVFAELSIKLINPFGEEVGFRPILRTPVANFPNYVYNNQEVNLEGFISSQQPAWQNNKIYLWSACMTDETIETVESIGSEWEYNSSARNYTYQPDKAIDKIFYIEVHRTDEETGENFTINIISEMFSYNSSTRLVTIREIFDKNGIQDNDIIIIGSRKEKFYQSPQYYFNTYSSPTIKANEQIDRNSIKLLSTGQTPVIAYEGETVTVHSRQVNIQSTYFQEQQIGLKYYTLTLLDESFNVILTTDKIYSQDINYNYAGFDSEKTYELRIEIVTQKNQVLNFNCNIVAEYSQAITPSLKPKIICDKKTASNIIQWAADKLSNAEVTGTYEFITTQNPQKVKINSGEIKYSKVNGLPINNEGNVSFRVQIDKATAFSNINYSNIEVVEWEKKSEGKIAQLKDNYIDSSGINKEVTMIIYCYRGQIMSTCCVKESNGTKRDTSKILYTLYSDQEHEELYAIQDSNVIDENKVYMWYNDATHTWKDSIDKFWVSNSIEGYTDETFLVIIRNYENAESVTVEKITEESDNI